MAPKLTVSGYRGIWGDTLTKEIAREYTRAFAAFVIEHGGTTVLVGRHARTSGPELLEAVCDELQNAGLNVLDLGMMPTPTVLFLVRRERAGGAIIITASHNPIEYNGLKFVTNTGTFTTEKDVAQIESLRTTSLPNKERGTRTQASDLFSAHLEAVLRAVHADAIRAQKFIVAIDPINSVGCTTTPQLLEKLGAQVVAINDTPSGTFAHEPEPLAKNLTALSELVKKSGAHVGFAQDPDGDRLVLCDEKGSIVFEEAGVALAIKAALARHRGDIAINLSTSNMAEDIAAEYGHRTWKSKVGEANVVGMMLAHSAVAGGEGSGGIIFPEVNAARDSFVGIALILDLMAQENKSLSTLVDELPKYVMKKDKFSFAGDLADVYTKLKALFPQAERSELDGLRLDFEDRSWIHARPSNTEPIVRIIVEAKTEERATELLAQARSTTFV